MSQNISAENIGNLLEIADQAGKILLGYFAQEVVIKKKADNSPVTDADMAANNFLCAALQKLDIDIPIVSEENSKADNVEAANNKEFWLIDPLDGTSAFINKDNNFAICIAKIKDSRPEFGLIHVPAANESFYNIGDNAFVLRHGQQTSIKVSNKKQNLHLIHSRRMKGNQLFEEYVKTRDIAKTSIISSAVKYCYIASGKAELYPHFLDNMHWDSAAGDAIVHAAGGVINDTAGKKLLYGNLNGFKNPHFIVSSDV